MIEKVNIQEFEIEIEWVITDYRADFKILNDPNCFTGMGGYVKWDGCMNITDDAPDHFCDNQQLNIFNDLMKYLRNKAKDLIPHADKESFNDEKS